MNREHESSDSDNDEDFVPSDGGCDVIENDKDGDSNGKLDEVEDDSDIDDIWALMNQKNEKKEIASVPIQSHQTQKEIHLSPPRVNVKQIESLQNPKEKEEKLIDIEKEKEKEKIIQKDYQPEMELKKNMSQKQNERPQSNKRKGFTLTFILHILSSKLWATRF
jgi:hypothetical protein